VIGPLSLCAFSTAASPSSPSLSARFRPMRSTLPFTISTCLIIAGLLAGCGGEAEPTETAKPKDPSTDASPAACLDAQFTASDAEPVDRIRVRNVPSSMGDSLFVKVVGSTDSLRTLAPARRVDSTRAEVQVPIHPAFRVEGGDVEMTLSNGRVDCPSIEFTIAPLERADGETGAVLDTGRVLAQAHARHFGVDEKALRSAPIDRLPGPVIPMALAFRAMETLRTDSSAQSMDTLDVAVLDAILAKGRAQTVLSAQLNRIRATEPIVSPSAVTGHSGDKQASPFQLASLPDRTPDRADARTARFTAGSLPPARPVTRAATQTYQCPDEAPVRPPDGLIHCVNSLVRVDPPDIPVTTPEQMSNLMSMSLRGEISLSEGVVEHLDRAIATLDASTAAYGWATASMPTPQAKKWSAALGSTMFGQAVYLKIIKLMRQAESQTLPRHIAEMSARMNPAVYDEDDDRTGRIQDIRLRVVSKGWKLDRTLMSMAMSTMDIDWVKGMSFELKQLGVPDIALPSGNEPINELFSTLFGEAVNDRATKDGESTGLLACVPSQSYTVSVWDTGWNNTRIVDGASVKAVDWYTYKPVTVGETRFKISLAAPSYGDVRFAGQGAHVCPVVKVEPIDVKVSPVRATVQAGQTVTLNAVVEHAQDPSLEWEVVRGDASWQRTGRHRSDPQREEVEVTMPDPMEGTVVVKARSTADRSHLLTASKERSGEAHLGDGPEQIAGLCDPDVMVDAVNEDASTGPVMNPEYLDSRGTRTPNPVRVNVSGLGMTGGVACSHHVGVIGEEGAKMAGLITRGEANAGIQARVEAMEGMAENLDSLQASGKLSGQAMGDAGQRLEEATTPSGGRLDDVLFQIYSPTAVIWQTGSLDDPRAVAHGGKAGWAPNASFLLNIHLPETRPADLQTGKTYAARAVAGEVEASGVVPTLGGFYSRWNGQVIDTPECPGADGEREEVLQACRRAQQRMKQLEKRIDAAGATAEGKMNEALKDVPEGFRPDVPVFSNMLERGVADAVDCEIEARLRSFSGTIEEVSGTLSGTVTITEITETEVVGTFALRGSGTKSIATHEPVACREQPGIITGTRRRTDTQQGPISVSGEVRAPNVEGGQFRVTMTTVEVDLNR